MGEVFKPGAPIGRDIGHLFYPARSPPTLIPRFRLRCVKCGRVFESILEAYRHQSTCPDACFRIILE